MTFAWDGNNGVLFFILNLILILLIYGFLFFAVLKVSKRTLSFILLIGSFVLFLTSFIFMLYPAMILVAVITLLALILTANANPGDVNKFLANPFKRVMLFVEIEESIVIILFFRSFSCH